MKIKIIFILLALFASVQLFSQCSVNSYIQTNYELDAKLLALRDILADDTDPDYDNPFLPNDRIVPYLEKLSALYENPINDPEINMIFNDFNIHVNQEYTYPIEFKTLTFGVATSLAWVQNFKNTGISGIPELDNLMSTYQFTIDNFIDFNSCSCTYFRVQTSYDFLNLNALIDDFELINDIDSAEAFIEDISIRYNYTGIAYTIVNNSGTPFEEQAPAQACDILVNGDQWIFSLYGGDCLSGCTVSESRIYTVDSNCNVLSNKKFEINQIKIYPIPATSILNITSKNKQYKISTTIYDLTGKKVLENELLNGTLDVSFLSSGVYVIKITQNNSVETQKLVIE